MKELNEQNQGIWVWLLGPGNLRLGILALIRELIWGFSSKLVPTVGLQWLGVTVPS